MADGYKKPMRQRLGVLLPAAAAGGAAYLLRRKRKSGQPAATFEPASRAPREDAGAPPSDSAATESVEETYTCECGTEYRVTGEGRHRVYWKADASISDPVIDGRCVECEKPLPGHHPAGDASSDREPSSEEAADGPEAEAAAAGEREASS